jgi:hypothetical protein
MATLSVPALLIIALTRFPGAWMMVREAMMRKPAATVVSGF